MRLPSLFRRPRFPRPVLFACGVIAILGAVCAVAGDITTVRLNEDLNFVESTVSEGAAGRHSIWADLGLTSEAIGLVAIGYGLWRWRGHTRRFKAGCAGLALTSLTILTIAWHNGYRDGGLASSLIHEPLVLLMSLLFAASLGLLAKELGETDTGYYRFSFIAAGAWLLTWPAFVVTPEAYAGAVERVAGFALIVWMTIAGRILMRVGRGERLDRGGL